MRTLAILCMCVLAAGNPVRLLEVKTTCDMPVATLARRAIAEDVLKKTAFEWSADHKISDWTYKTITGNAARALSVVRRNEELKQSASLRCVAVGYSVHVKMPAFVAGYTSTVSVSKTICSTDDMIFERLEFENLPLVGHLTVVANTKLLPGSMHVTTATDIVMPAIFSVAPYLASTAEAYVKRRWRHKNDLFVEELCGI